MYALNLGDNGRILSASYPEYAPGGVAVEALPEGNIADYRYVDGAFVLDALPVDEPTPVPTQEERTAELEEALALLLSGAVE